MTPGTRSPRRLLLATFAMFVLLLLPAAAAAQEGKVGLRYFHYRERSTRVQQPMLDASYADANGELKGHFLVDVITSASVATGAGGEPFTEKRYEVGGGYTWFLGEVKLGGAARFSTESDYTSRFVSVNAEIELNEKNTVLAFTEARGWDDINNGVEVDRGGIGTPRRSESLHVGLTSVSVTQILSPVLVGTLTYDFIDQHGFQANIYRVVFGGASPVPERVPETRLRHAAAGALRGFVPQTRTTLVGMYRFYIDDWGIVGHTPEVRLIQQIVSGLDLRLRYRYHTQTKADFYQDVYTADEIQNDPYVASDEKLSAHQTQTFGGQLAVGLEELGLSLGFDARIDFVVERLLQTTSFGNAWIVHGGVTVPF